MELLYAAVEFAPLSAHVTDQFCRSWAQACPPVLIDQDRQLALEFAPASRNDNPPFQ
jgi:hypothetical protein